MVAKGAEADGNSKRPQCHVCCKVGHTADKCWYRYDEDYVPDARHTAATATTSYNVDKNWYADSGATDHIMSELDKLVVHEKYNGTDKVHTASGSGMAISHIGKSFIHIPTHKLQLSNILHVPNATKSLMSIHHFPWIIMYSLKFTLGSFSLRIGTRGTLFLGGDVLMAFLPYLPLHNPSSFLSESINHLSLDGMID
jgi:hypothetical protein